MKSKVSLFVILLALTGCFDTFTAEMSAKLIGGISVIYPDNKKDEIGHRLVWEENASRRYLLDEYIIRVKGDKDVMAVEALDPESCKTVFYRIDHKNGQLPVDKRLITEEEYHKVLDEIPFPFRFETDVPPCKEQ